MTSLKILLALFLLNILPLSCSSATPSMSKPSPYWTSPPDLSAEAVPFPVGAELSLKEALQRARAHSPRLRAAQAQLQAQSERTGVSGRLADPEFSIRLEDSPFPSSGLGGDTLTGIRQPFSISGQQGKQLAVATARLHTLQLRHDRLAMELEGEIRGLFATALTLQRARTIQSNLVEIAHAMDVLMHARVAAGDGVLADLTKTTDLLVRRKAQQQEMLQNHELAKMALFSKIGVSETPRLQEKLGDVLQLPDLRNLLDQIQALPIVAEAQAQAQVARLTAILAESKRIPTVNLELFYRQKDEGSNALDAGILFALPLSGRTAAEHQAAKAEADAAAHQGRLRQQEALVELKRRHATLARALEEVNRYQSKLIPSGNLRRTTIEAKLQVGDVSLAEVLPIREEAALLELAHLDAWHQLMSAWAELSRIMNTVESNSRG